jgi:hypothetical protein
MVIIFIPYFISTHFFKVVLAKEICDVCKQTVQYDDFYSLNCEYNHPSCSLCYKQHVQTQVSVFK